jgi:hypothetical protein
MKNRKGIVVGLTYALMAFYFLYTDQSSAFIFLFSLIMEILLMLFLYMIMRSVFKKYARPLSGSIFIGALPLLIICYIAAFTSAYLIDGIELSEYENSFEPIIPILVYKKQLIALSLGLIASYIFAFFELKRHPRSIDQLQNDLFRMGISIWLTSMLAFAVFFAIPRSLILYTVVILALFRVLLEFTVLKKIR